MKVNGQLHAPASLPWGIAPGTHWIGGGVGSIAGLDEVAKRKLLASAGKQTPVVQFVTYSLY
jgi:hypothetical protein